jgi:phosphatidylserine/phosphatidylglycerophosphate/cardiolipin synthase-like enzyme
MTGTKDMQYIHSKTWIFDDELAIIGSANCNRRSWEHDSEVAAVILDTRKVDGGATFAQALRMKLWAGHLGTGKKSSLTDLPAHGTGPGRMRSPLRNARSAATISLRSGSGNPFRGIS